MFAAPRMIRGAWLPLFLMIGAAAVPIILFALIMLGLFNSRMEHALTTMMQYTASSSVEAVEAKLREDASALQALGSGLDDGVDAFRRQGERLLAARPDWIALHLVDVQGRLPALSIGSEHPPSPEPQLLDQAVRSGKPAIGNLRSGPDPDPYAAIYVPVLAHGQAATVIVATLRTRSFSDILRQQRSPDDWAIGLLDRDHRIVGRSTGHDQYVGTEASESLKRGLATKSQLFFAEGKDGNEAFTAAVRSANWGWTVAVGAPAEIVRAPARRTMFVLAAGGGIALLLAVWLSLVVARAVHRRQLAERRLTAIKTFKTAERRLSQIARNFPGVIYRRVLHSDGRVSYPYIGGANTSDYIPTMGQRISLGEAGDTMFQPDDGRGWQAALLHSARTLEPFHYEGRARTDDDLPRWVRTMARPLREPNGDVVWDGVALDITDLKLAEAHMAASLEHKETMLREIHHRVRNNLQVVSSLIQIESFQIADADARRRLADVSRRIGALGHLHEMLYASADFARIDCGEHLRRLCETIAEAQPTPVEIIVDAAPLHCDIDTAIPLGLLAHEMVTFELGHSRRLRVRLAPADRGSVVLSIDCCGHGKEARRAGEIGSRIIRALAAQVDGVLEISAAEPCVRLRIDGRRFG